jgi:hypothetical protein
MSGSLSGKIQTGRSLDYENAKERRMSSLLLNVMDHMGVHLNEFGNASEYLPSI